MDFYSVSRLLSTTVISFVALSSVVQAQSGFSVLPKNITVQVSFPAQFDCQARPGAGFIRWAVGSNFEVLSENNCDGCQLQSNGSLYIPSVTPAHSGVYTCLIVGGSSQQAMFSVYLTTVAAISTTMTFDTMIPVMTTTTMASDISTMSTTATPNDVPVSNNSGSSSDSGAIIGGVVGGVILLLMITVVLCIVILCMRRSHRREPSRVCDQVFYDTTKLSTDVTIKHNPSYKATEDETADSLHSTINEDSDVPITTNSVPAIPCSKTSEDEYADTVHGVSTGEDKPTATDYDTKSHQSSQQYDYDDVHDDPAQLCHDMATTTTADVEEDNVQIHTTLDQRHGTNTTHSPLTASTTMQTDEDKHDSFDTTVDQSPTAISCLPSIAKPAGEDDINKPQCDDISFNTTVDQSPTAKPSPLPYLPLTANGARSTDEDEYGIINQPQYNDLM